MVLGAAVCTVAVPAADRVGETVPAVVDMVIFGAAPAFACADENHPVVEYSGYTSYSPA